MANELRGGLKGEVGTTPVFTLPEGSADEVATARETDALLICDAILKGKPFVAATRARQLASDAKTDVTGVGIRLAALCDKEELAYLLALQLVTTMGGK